ncbi:MAG: phenylalanine--tRNA ligase subunit alpha, partial [Candidatus Nitrosotenuis sp.]
MSQVLHPIEKTIIKLLKTTPNLTEEQIAERTNLSIDQTRRGIEWLRLKSLATVSESEKSFVTLGANGLKAKQEGLPERKLVNLISSAPASFSELQKKLHGEINVAIANAKKNDWIEIKKGETENIVSLKQNPGQTREEKMISYIAENKVAVDQIKDTTILESIKRRPDFIIIETTKSRTVSLSEQAKTIDTEKEHTGEIDVEADVPRVYAARTHPLKDTIDEIREVFVSLGFSEIMGSLVQPSFWNFDALFTPQDHPAREMQDTFYIKEKAAEKFASPTQIRRVSDSHKKSWKYDWSSDAARKMVLRTHTTCVT